MGVESPFNHSRAGDLSGRLFCAQMQMDIGRLGPRMSTADHRLGGFRFPVLRLKAASVAKCASLNYLMFGTQQLGISTS